eukprot:6383245-Prymnesium_polylepis.3
MIALNSVRCNLEHRVSSIDSAHSPQPDADFPTPRRPACAFALQENPLLPALLDPLFVAGPLEKVAINDVVRQAFGGHLLVCSHTLSEALVNEAPRQLRLLVCGEIPVACEVLVLPDDGVHRGLVDELVRDELPPRKNGTLRTRGGLPVPRV